MQPGLDEHFDLEFGLKTLHCKYYAAQLYGHFMLQ